MRLAALAPLLLAGCVGPGTTSALPAANALTQPDRTAIDAIAQEYVRLTLAMDAHDPGYVDAYYGPPAVRDTVRAQELELPAIGNGFVELMGGLDALPPAFDPMERRRRAMLSAQLEAAVTRHAMVSGETLPFVREARGLFGVAVTILPLDAYDPVLEEIDQLVPGVGPLPERVAAFRDRFVIPPDRLERVFAAAIAECRRRTAEHLDLPEGEAFRMEFVTGKSWSGYNYYQGDYKSLIQINTDLPIHIDRAVDLGCHEGYPGHHVYNMLLERDLARGRGWSEYTVYPLYSPQSLIAEGSANYGIELAFPGVRRLKYERDILYPMAGLDPQGAAAYWAFGIAMRALSGARITITQGYLDGEIDRGEAVALTQRYQLVSKDRAEQMLDFADEYRSYVINYGLGEQMVAAWVEAEGDGQRERWAAMARLLSEPTLPRDLLSDDRKRNE